MATDLALSSTVSTVTSSAPERSHKTFKHIA
jgi:hypothetical protein